MIIIPFLIVLIFVIIIISLKRKKNISMKCNSRFKRNLKFHISLPKIRKLYRFRFRTSNTKLLKLINEYKKSSKSNGN